MLNITIITVSVTPLVLFINYYTKYCCSYITYCK